MQRHTGKLVADRELARAPRASLTRTRTLLRGAIVSPPVFAGARRPAYLAVKAVGSFVPKLTQKSFEKYGFSTATLITDWARVVGADLARDTLPERLKWPRGAAAGATADEGSGAGATLVLRVDPARALDISYKERLIIERINTFFGYRAVTGLRIVQAPVDVSAQPPQRQTARVPVAPCEIVTPIGSDNALGDALARLGAGVLGRTRTVKKA